MSYVNHLSELTGYLKALERMCGSNYIFGVSELPQGEIGAESIRQFIFGINSNALYFGGTEELGYSDFIVRLEKILFNGLLSKDRFSEKLWVRFSTVIKDDIDEYFGLISTSINSNGVFYPLKKNLLNRIVTSADDDENNLFLVVEIEEHKFLCYFYRKNKKERG